MEDKEPVYPTGGVDMKMWSYQYKKSYNGISNTGYWKGEVLYINMVHFY